MSSYYVSLHTQTTTESHRMAFEATLNACRPVNKCNSVSFYDFWKQIQPLILAVKVSEFEGKV